MLEKKNCIFKPKLDNNHMRVVKEKGRRMKWPLFVDRSRQQPTNMNKKNPLTSGGEPLKDSNHPCTIASAALSSPHLHSHRPRPTIFILLVLAIGLLVFDIIPRENVIFDIANNGFDVLYEYECEFYCDALSSHVSNASDTNGAATVTSCNCCPGCVGLGEFNVSGCDLAAVLPATTIATIATTVGIENEIIFDSDDTLHTPQPGPDVPAPPHDTLHTIDRTRPVGVGLREFDVNFNGNMDIIGLPYDMLSSMFIFIFIFFFFDCFVVKC